MKSVYPSEQAKLMFYDPLLIKYDPLLTIYDPLFKIYKPISLIDSTNDQWGMNSSPELVRLYFEIPH
ncbi:hypothetical protein C0966_13410 [Bacillus methanolicus]|nr:hypothetical protein [Bacillus methanolicus]